MPEFGKDKVVGGLARVGVAMSAEGTILHTSPFAAISFGERDGKPPRAVAGRARCGDQEVRHRRRAASRTSSRISGTSGSCSCSLAATCCLMRGSSGDILEADEGQAIMLETVEECHKVAAAAGHDPGDKGMQTIRVVPDRQGLALHRLDAARPREGRDGRGRPCRGRHDRPGKKGWNFHAQPAHGLCPSAGLFGPPRLSGRVEGVRPFRMVTRTRSVRRSSSALPTMSV